LPVQDCPAVHDTQLPDELHTRFVPQVVPAGLVVLSMQARTPVEQSVLPV
jgi:hypothetical protein